MKRVFLFSVVILLVLLTGTVQAEPTAPVRLPHVDYDCDGEITVNDVLMLVPHMGETTPAALWLYDLDRDGAILVYDALIVVAEIGRVDLPAPLWCEE